ncbi:MULTISPECIES: histidine phosphatase family protein [unclassified Mycobacterium]|uniref:histidine phosphatase family protein n=1 Tax=unclassified Mycobacterium TaxID=2642494 RepID=UPI00042920BE|nr:MULTISPECIES: histidine phosphatase family protein [unclassified Mycobacterium]
MQHTRPWITAGVALVGAGLVAVAPVAPIAAPLPGIARPDITLTAVDMVLDLVRHGQSTENVSDYVGTTPPGAPLTELGEQQAIDVGNGLYNGGDNNIGGVYASDFLRAQQTAWPLVQLLAGQPVDPANFPDGPPPLLAPEQILSGLGEINAGWLEGQSGTISGLLYLLPTIAWMTGAYWVPMLGSDINPNGMAFQDNFGGAIQTIYDATTADPDSSGVAFSHGAAIMAWTMMNVQNPDWGLYLDTLVNDRGLPNTGQVVVEGNPTDGWTLVSWNGTEVAENPDLLTGLFVDWRDLITAPQMAGWHIWEAILGGDPSDILAALQTGFNDVFSALVEFPQAVIDTIAGAFGDAAGSGSAEAWGDLLGALAI